MNLPVLLLSAPFISPFADNFSTRNLAPARKKFGSSWRSLVIAFAHYKTVIFSIIVIFRRDSFVENQLKFYNIPGDSGLFLMVEVFFFF